MLTAWVASRECPRASRLLDIGAGIGSVGLMTLWRMPMTTTLVAVEVQEISHRLMRQTVENNGLGERVTLRLGDLRDPTSVPEVGVFDLVTGSPPYIPLGKGVVSPHPQRAGARMELRGTIADYAVTAARALAPGGRFVVCFPAADPRGVAAISAAGLHLRVRQDIVFRPYEPPLISIMVAAHEPGPTEYRPIFRIRDDAGVWTEPYLDVREEMGTVLNRI